MNLSGGSATGIAGAVWVNATRSLTNTGTMLAQVQVAQTAIAANGNVNLRPAAGKIREVSIAIKSGAAGAANILITDGTNLATAVTVAQGGNTAVFGLMGTFSVGPQVFNGDATNQAFYWMVGLDWTL